MRRTSLLLALAGLTLAACGTPAANGQETPSDKVFVCKYVRKPGENGFELLQTGQNPISVSINALVGPGVEVNIGDEFEDAHGKSVVIAFDTGQPEPDVSDCPGFVTVTTTTAPTTTTSTTTTAPTTTSTTLPPTTTSTTSTTSTTTSTTSTPTTAPPSPPPPGVPAITFSFLGPRCVDDHPFLGWVITAQNLPAASTATITIRDINGVVVKQLFDQPLTGATLWPGATINPDDWPGWIKVGDTWVEDPTDAVVREGVFVTAEVNPEATGFVTYPPATAACANPQNPPIPPGAPPVAPPPAAPPATTVPPGLPPTK